MTHRERLLGVLDGTSVDRVPIWLLFPYHATSYYANVRANPCYTEIFEASKEYAVMLNRRSFRVRLFAPEVETGEEERREAPGRVRREFLRLGPRRLCGETRTVSGRTEVKKLLATEEDLRTWASFPLNTDARRIHAELDAQLPKYLEEKREFPAPSGAMMLDLGEPVAPLYHAADLGEYAVWSLTADDVVHEWLDRAMERLRIVYRWCLERDLADVYFLVGSELASPPMVSRTTFRRWIVPYAKELTALIHSFGKKVIVHYHGRIREILDDFVEIAPDGLHTIEAPPTGNCTLTQAFEVTGNRITLIGNIQYDCFRSFTNEQMADAVHAVIDEARGRRFILSPTAGPYEEHIPRRMIDNYLTFLKTGWEYGTGKAK